MAQGNWKKSYPIVRKITVKNRKHPNAEESRPKVRDKFALIISPDRPRLHTSRVHLARSRRIMHEVHECDSTNVIRHPSLNTGRARLDGRPLHPAITRYFDDSAARLASSSLKRLRGGTIVRPDGSEDVTFTSSVELMTESSRARRESRAGRTRSRSRV